MKHRHVDIKIKRCMPGTLAWQRTRLGDAAKSQDGDTDEFIIFRV